MFRLQSLQGAICCVRPRNVDRGSESANRAIIARKNKSDRSEPTTTNRQLDYDLTPEILSEVKVGGLCL
jgi:hypothetical protein